MQEHLALYGNVTYVNKSQTLLSFTLRFTVLIYIWHNKTMF